MAGANLTEAIRLREKALALGCVLHHDGESCRDGGLVGSIKATRWVAENPGKTPRLSELGLVQDPALDDYYNSLVHLGFFVETPEGDGSEEGDDRPEGVRVNVSDLELSELGRRVAASYEGAVGSLPVVAKLTREPDGCRPGELKKWGERGGICEVAEDGAPDRALLQEVFFDKVGSPGESHKFRHDTLALFLELIEGIAPHGISLEHMVLGDAVYFGATAAGEDGSEVVALRFPAPLEDIANRWRMFYFHYYLSVALECLLVGVVGYAHQAGMTGTRVETIVESLKSKSVARFLRQTLGTELGGGFLEGTPRQLFRAAGFGVAGGDFRAGNDFEEHFNYAHPLSERKLNDRLRNGENAYAKPEGIACALVLMMVTVCRYTRWHGGPYGNWLARATGDPYRDVTVPVVLQCLRESLGDFLDATWREIAMLVMRRFVVSQHEVLSYEKARDGSRALFNSDQGVIRWRGLSYDEVAVGSSRFHSAVQVLEDLALAEHGVDDRWQVKLTAGGKRFLKAELARMEGA